MILLYHGLPKSQNPKGFQFRPLGEHSEGIHLGTLAQARMRAGGGAILEVEIDGFENFKRVKDRDSTWTKILKRHARQGTSGLVYLNRHEGIQIESATRLGKIGLVNSAALSDAAFKKYAPEAEDSVILLDSTLARITKVFPDISKHQS